MENILEYLIPLIFIVSFLGMRKKKKKGPGAGKTPEHTAEQVSAQTKLIDKGGYKGIGGKLNKMLKEYYESDSEQAAEKGAGRTWVEESTEARQVFREPEPWEDEDEVLAEAQQQMSHLPKQHPMDLQSPAPQQSTAVVQPKPVPEPVVKPVERAEIKPEPDVLEPEQQLYDSPKQVVYSPQIASVSRTDIRRAIIWSEILAPPKALREE